MPAPGGLSETEAERRFARAVAAHRAGDQGAAEKALRPLVRALPDHPDILHLLGVVHLAAGRPTEAIESLRRAAKAAEAQGRADIAPGILNALGSALRRAKRAPEAVEVLGRAARLAPQDADVRFNLANALQAAHRPREAADSFKDAARLNPADPDLLFGLGEALLFEGDGDGALAVFEKIAATTPGHAKAHNAVASIHLERLNLPAARAALDRALALAPDAPEVNLILGLYRLSAGDAEGGIAASARAVARDPSLASAHSNLILQMGYSARHSAADLLAEARAWNAAYAAPLAAQAKPHANARDPDKRLKIGYVGGDFRAHPVGWFTLALFKAHDPAQVETFVYMTGAAVDGVSERLRAAAHRWRAVHDLGPSELADAVRADGIDILVDMAGHTAKNRLLTFAERPAPIQALGGGLTGTTGLAAMDYILADRFEIPPGYEKFYSEAVVRLPGDYICYAPPDHGPEVASLPALARGGVTFGCFNHAAKIGPDAIALWARVLKAVPRSRLLLKSFAFSLADVRDRFAGLFAENGIGPERLILEGPSPHAELLAAYGRVDIALDPMPYSGGLTTLESLWMGVPVVTLPGETFASRHSASHLANTGLPELIARDADDYVAIAARLAGDLDTLAALRARLRPQLAASPVCDGAAYARGLESAFRAMWRRWIAGEKPSGFNVL